MRVTEFLLRTILSGAAELSNYRKGSEVSGHNYHNTIRFRDKSDGFSTDKQDNYRCTLPIVPKIVLQPNSPKFKQSN